MARKPRIQYAGAVYHVMNRGDRGGKTFRDRLDYDLFLQATGEVCERAGWRLHAYALLPNHFHWLVETPQANLVDGMKWFLGAYSQRFNARHGQRGADYAKKMRKEGWFQLEDDAFKLLYEACVKHTDGELEGHPALITCWDADRLDLWRCGIRPDPTKMCTATARQKDVISWAMTRSGGLKKGGAT